MLILDLQSNYRLYDSNSFPRRKHKGQVIQMKNSEKEMWETNIENSASARYGAHDFYDLASCYYSEVFADLEMMANDN